MLNRLREVKSSAQAWAGWVTSRDTVPIIRAYEEVAWFGTSIDYRRNGFTQVPFDLIDISNGEVVADEMSTDELPPQANVFNILAEMFTDLDLYGAAYAVFETNQFGMNGKWRRLVANSIEPIWNNQDGIVGFRRNDSFSAGVGRNFSIDDPAFLWLWSPNFGADAEIAPGEGIGKRGLIAASSLLNMGKTVAAFWEKGGIPPTIVSLPNFETFDADDKERTKTFFQRTIGNVKRMFGTHVIGDDIQIHQLMYALKDLSIDKLTQVQRESIATALGVPQSILFSNAANVATAQVDQFSFFNLSIVPTAKAVIATQLNERLFLPHGLKLQYREQRMDIYQDQQLDKVQSLIALQREGDIDADEVRARTGFPEREIEDVPERLLTDGNVNEDEARLNRLSDDSKSTKAISHDAFAGISFANNSQLIRIQRILKSLIDSDDVRWELPPTFHITLVYSPEMDSDQLFNVAKNFSFTEFMLSTCRFGIFENGDERALHLVVKPNDKLSDMQSELYELFRAENVALSPFSNPEQYTPHITMAYLPKGIQISEFALADFNGNAEKVVFTRDDYEPFAIVQGREFKSLDSEKAWHDELNTWQAVTLKRLKKGAGSMKRALEFEVKDIPPVQGEFIREALNSVDNADDVKALFLEAKNTSKYWADY